MVSREKRAIPRILPLITAVFALVILIKIVWVIFFTPSETSSYVDPPVSTQVVRGPIIDRNGNLLAVEVPYYSCALLLREIPNLPIVASKIGPLVGVDPNVIVKEASQRSTYYTVKRKLSTSEYESLILLQDSEPLKGLLIEKQFGRLYPQHYHAAQIIGFTNTENRGIEGLELAYESYLFPYPEIDTSITWGAVLQLTLDMDLQYLLDTQVVSIDREHFPDSVTGIIMGAETGEILAAATFPWYDPNEYQLSEPEYRQNKIITSMYEPGSVFKIFSLAAELKADQAHFDEPFYCDGSYSFTMPNGELTTIQCVSAHGNITPESMIQNSCNGAVAHWALQTDDTKFYETLSNFGFGRIWETGMPGAISGVLNPVSSWSGRSKATISFGQEVAATPLQIVTAATALTTDGHVLSPYMIRTIWSHDGKELLSNQPQIAVDSLLSQTIVDTVLQGMELAAQTGGTASRIAVEGVRIGAKTGTAQITDAATGAYGPDSFLASTLAIVPLEDPKYIIYIGVTNPKGSTIWGSNIAAPAIGNIIADMVRQGKIASSAMETLTFDSVQQLIDQP